MSALSQRSWFEGRALQELSITQALKRRFTESFMIIKLLHNFALEFEVVLEFKINLICQDWSWKNFKKEYTVYNKQLATYCPKWKVEIACKHFFLKQYNFSAIQNNSFWITISIGQIITQPRTTKVDIEKSTTAQHKKMLQTFWRVISGSQICTSYKTKSPNSTQKSTTKVLKKCRLEKFLRGRAFLKKYLLPAFKKTAD